MWLARVTFLTSIGILVLGHASAATSPTLVTKFVLIADSDDDDLDGRGDGNQDVVPVRGRIDLVPLPASYVGGVLTPVRAAESVRVLLDGRPLAWGEPIRRGAAFQGREVGTAELSLRRGKVEQSVSIEVRGVAFRDGHGSEIDPARSHASIERTPPSAVPDSTDEPYNDPDALRVVLKLPPGSDGQATLPVVSAESFAADGSRLDTLGNVSLRAITCFHPPAEDHCFASEPLRLVVDEVDRAHPLVVDRSLRGEVGGALTIRLDGKKAQTLRVLGPRASSVGPIRRLKATIRPYVVRVVPGGAPSIGTNPAGAIALFRTELAFASAIWGQCGITFGDSRMYDVRVVDPPPSHLLAIGDDAALPASGGQIRFRIDGRPLSISIRAGSPVSEVADEVAIAVEKAGFVAIISPNARIGSGSASSVDVLMRHANGSLATLEMPVSGGALCTDQTLSVRIGSVDLIDGLHHFRDVDSVAGTLEERTLIKALDDGDPSTIKIIVVPSFSGGIRIGESFIGSDASSLRNVIVLDRAGLRARRTSLTLAHEIGHVLLDLADHPDDYGTDSPTQLMDSDASDASPFGPRRITVEECARAVRQSGPGARIPLLTDYPLRP